MKNLLLYIAAFCCIASFTMASERLLDSTLIVTKKGLTVLDGAAPVQFRCGREWSLAFTQNGGTVTLRTKKGYWTLTGLSSEIALAAISEGAPLVAGVATAIGVSPADVQAATAKTLELASGIAQYIGTPAFDGALAQAVAIANDLLHAQGIHPSDFNDEILAATALLGPSGGVVDASDTTVEDVHREAQKVIGIILNALASSGAFSQ